MYTPNYGSLMYPGLVIFMVSQCGLFLLPLVINKFTVAVISTLSVGWGPLVLVLPVCPCVVTMECYQVASCQVTLISVCTPVCVLVRISVCVCVCVCVYVWE